MPQVVALLPNAVNRVMMKKKVLLVFEIFTRMEVYCKYIQ